MKTASPLPISVCMIAGAEAHRIGRALESVADWAAEIIVVINEEVADGTDQIALAAGARVFREPWRGYVAQKNSAAQKATQDWMLGLDADEVVTPELRDEIQRTLADKNLAEHFAAFRFPRCTMYRGRWIRHGVWYPDHQTRLWRRDRARWSGLVLHERLEVNGRIGTLRAELQHYSMESAAHQIQKTIRYADHFAEQCRLRGRRVGFLDLLFRPAWSFFRGYVLKLGFLDGWHGLSIAWMTVFYTFLRYDRARETQWNEKRQP